MNMSRNYCNGCKTFQDDCSKCDDCNDTYCETCLISHTCIEDPVIVDDFEDHPDIQELLQKSVDSKMSIVWAFNEAPQYLRELYSKGGDETVLVFIPSTSSVGIDTLLGQYSDAYIFREEYGKFVTKCHA